MIRCVLAIFMVGSLSSTAVAQKVDRLKLYEVEYSRCVRYYLSDEKIGRSLALLNIHPGDLCQCSTPIFVSSLSDAEAVGMSRGAAGFTTSIVDRFAKAGQYCTAKMMN